MVITPPNSDTSQVNIQCRIMNDNPLPLVIEPADEVSKNPALLKAWVAANKEWLDEKLLEHGAFLLRGFEIEKPTDFEQAAWSFDNNLKNDYLGTSPRNMVEGTNYVFSASELPNYYPIMQHCEMTFLPGTPRKLFFYCEQAPTFGGETPLTDFRKVYQDLRPIVRKVFELKGIRYIRNYTGPKSRGFDMWKLKEWHEMFQTTDKAVVEKKCKENELAVEWKKDDKLCLINERPAFKKHPETGEMAWFNHLQVFHLEAAAIEYQKIRDRHKTLSSVGVSLLTSAMTAFKRNFTPSSEQALHCTFADGMEIPTDYVQHVQDVIWDNMVLIPWQKGDVFVIDNFSVAHGRMPYQGPRNILVSWAAEA